MGLSIRAYARQRGVSHVAVPRAIKTGRMDSEPHGTVEAKTDASWGRSTDRVMLLARIPLELISQRPALSERWHGPSSGRSGLSNLESRRGQVQTVRHG